MRTPALRLMAATVKDILACLDANYPFAWALPEDRVGLQVGDPQATVTRVLVALEASLTVVAEAEAQGAQLLLTHHPLLYQPAVDIREDRATGKLLAAVVRAKVAVAACHTYGQFPIPDNLDEIQFEMPKRESFQEFLTR